MKARSCLLFAAILVLFVVTAFAQTVWTVEKAQSGAAGRPMWVCKIGSLFIGFGTSGTNSKNSIFTSSDGINWIFRAFSPNLYTSVTRAGSTFVAISEGGNIALSTDGFNWTFKTLCGNGYPVDFSAIAYSGSLLAATSKDSGNGLILTSANGTTWSVAYSDAQAINNIIWTGTEFIAVGEKGRFLTSQTGSSWVGGFVPLKTSLTEIAWTGAFIVFNGDGGGSFISPDASTWMIAATPIPVSGYYYTRQLLWSGHALVRTVDPNVIETSTDGIYWNMQTLNTINYLYSIVFTGTEFLAYGSGSGMDTVYIMSSPLDTSITSPLSKKQSTAPASMLIQGSGNVVRYSLSEPSQVKLRFFDLLGKQVFCGINSVQGAGRYQFSIPSGAMAAGRYVRLFEAGNFVKQDLVTTRK